MSQIAFEIEEMLREGYKPTSIAGLLNVPIEWVYNVEEDLMQLADPRFYGPDYDEQ